MTELHAAIRAKLAAWGDDPCGFATCVVVPGYAELRAAAAAVLDRHGPGYPAGVEFEWRSEPTYFADGTFAARTRRKGEQTPGYYCETCQVLCPCDTVQDIAKALGVKPAADA
jgi:hypothetical protein